MEKEFDFIAIGDITTDAFIKLKDAKVNCDINEENCMISMRFGDKIPYEELNVIPAVGNSPNAAVSAARLELASAVVTNVGDDKFGAEDIETLKEQGVDTTFVKTNPGKKTNYHFVLSYDAERTILIKHEEFDYSIPEIGTPKWIYLSSLGENSLPHHHEIAKFIKDNPEIKLAFQPGTFQIKLGHEALVDLYEVTELFFCNVEEAKRILNNKDLEIKELLTEMHKLGPKIVVITDGPDGAYTYDGNDMLHMPIYPDPKPPVERTGAGDAFSSTFTSALASGKTVSEALMWGPINSMSVVQDIGAQRGLLSREKLEEYLANAPEDYKPTKI